MNHNENDDDNDITEKIQNITINNKTDAKKSVLPKDEDLDQLSLFDTVKDEDIINEIKELDISNLTPIDALNTLDRFKRKLLNRW